MAAIKEVVTLENGKQVTLTLTPEEHAFLLSYAFNYFIATGIVAVSERDPVAEANQGELLPETLVPGNGSIN